MSPAGAFGRDALRPVEKSPDAFRTISEVADDLDLPQHVLRFWETRFPQIKPLKRGGGRRYYRPDDVDLLKGIRHLLYGEGYTIKGVQRILKEDGIRFVQSIGRGEQSVEPARGSDTDREQGGVGETGAGSDEDLGVHSAPESVPAGPGRDADLNSAAEENRGFADGDAARLRNALDELLECARLLKALNTPVPNDDELPPR